jgi:dihydrofolate reductase
VQFIITGRQADNILIDNSIYRKQDMTTDFKLTIHMVSSLDGFIAKKDNSISWFETNDYYEKGVGEPDVAAFLKTIDCYIMGSRTYELALELSKSYGWAYGDKPTIVLSHRKLPVERTNVRIHDGDLIQFVNEQLKPNYKNVWLVGGAMLAKEFIGLKLADEIRISILPIILGDGTPFFDRIGLEQTLHLKDVTTYKNGMVELWYEIKKDKQDQHE